MKTYAKVTGIKRSRGVLDNGKPYDSTTLYVEFPFGQSDDMRGSATQPMKYGTSDNYEKFKGVALPFDAELNLEVETNGNRMQTVVTDVRVAGQDKQTSKPAA
ncbi:hypothetical protein [Neisseria iguanae]|uniref:Uncharacterized protein n=1 Tax=Neisseria iguanae TaxID=90242 RepID=A0A2P7TYL3_9NEIS|nr:hypothetical protein [Neisseria iguanae]PSJ79808.1 hypothetical protein C7N83_10035 [Neisseria iguanae]